MAPELVAGGGYGGLIREKPHCAKVRSEKSTSETHQVCSTHSEPYTIRLLLMNMVQFSISNP